MEIRKPAIKSIPYDEWKDNETLEQIINELNEGGVNCVLGNLDAHNNGPWFAGTQTILFYYQYGNGAVMTRNLLGSVYVYVGCNF